MVEQGEDFSSSFYSDLRVVITLVDNLRDAGLQKYIMLPRIAVIGVQSSGKSSVLESIVGLNFLPRGEGVCTRRPLELRLVHTPGSEKPWGEFEGIDKKFVNFDEVREQIENLTAKKAGTNKEIIDDPITLTIYSSTCPDLTLIDLPGITRIAVGGQDKNIYKITKNMTNRYIKDARTIILCVCPANIDMATQDSIQMAMSVDRAGIRTQGVLTKVDIMDKGVDARRMIMGQDVSLRHGFVAIKNRSQQDIIDNKRVDEALNEEKFFFSNHPVYSTMPPDFFGIPALTNKLTKILFNHIKHFLPEILKETLLRIKECEDKLKELGPSAPEGVTGKTQLLWNLINEFCEVFKNIISGRINRTRHSRITKDLAGGVTIKSYFYTLLEDYADGKYKATSGYSDEEIQKTMIQYEGDSIPGFPSVDVFLALLYPQLERIREPVLDCLNDVHSYLEQLAHKLIERIFYRFPGLVQEISMTSSAVMFREKEKCREIVDSVIQSEINYIFTNDTNYLTMRTDIIPKNQNSKDPYSVFIDEIRVRIDSYYDLVIKNVRDCVPKIIGQYLVRSVMDKIHLELYEKINQNAAILDLLSEPALITTEREVLKKQVAIMRKAEKIMKHDPQLASQAVNIEEEIRKQEEELKGKEEKKTKPDPKREEPRREEIREELKPSVPERRPEEPVKRDNPEPAKKINEGLFGKPAKGNNLFR